MHLALALAAVLAVLLGPAGATGETFRLVAPDGTVYYTNAPTDPAYRRMGLRTGTETGWLRLPPGEPIGGVFPHIKAAAERYGIPEKLVTAVIRVESGFNPRAISSKGARGLMQLMPETASLLGVRDSFDPADNIDGGVRHLKRLIDRFSNNLPLALAAYNAGEQAVANYRGIPPYPETQGYVQRVLSFFYGGPGAAVAPRAIPAAVIPPTPETYRTVADDGTVMYTNIPPRPRR